jgi:hypothetical protein
MKKTIKMHEERKTKQKTDENVPEGAVPAYLLDREGQSRAKVLSNMIKQKRKEKAVNYQHSTFIFMRLRVSFGRAAQVQTMLKYGVCWAAGRRGKT